MICGPWAAGAQQVQTIGSGDVMTEQEFLNGLESALAPELHSGPASASSERVAPLGIGGLMDGAQNYAPPELLPNGDIVIRRLKRAGMVAPMPPHAPAP